MSVAGDTPNFNFAKAQVEDRNDRRWSTSWCARRARRSRHLTSTTPYGYGAISPTKLDRRRPANTDDEELSHPGLDTSCSFVSAVICCAITLAIVFYFAGISERHTLFPQPMGPSEELEKYRNSGIYWDPPWSLECLDNYYHRRYASRLQNVSHARGFDTLRACKALPITIKKQFLETPDECKGVGAYMYGYWTVYDPSGCTVDDEIQRYRDAGMFWDITVRADHCYSYDKREYEARLLNIPTGYNPMKSCKYIPIRIQDQVLERPDSCELRDVGVLGKWIVSNQMDCRPYWGPLHDAGCQASGKKRYEAPLWNLNEKKEKYRSPMCYSTPATWHGIYYAHPTVCDDRKRGGMTGIWETESC